MIENSLCEEKKNFDTESLENQQVQLQVQPKLFLKNEPDLQSLRIKVFYSRTQTIFDCILPQWMVKIEKKTFIQKYGAFRMGLP